MTKVICQYFIFIITLNSYCQVLTYDEKRKLINNKISSITYLSDSLTDNTINYVFGIHHENLLKSNTHPFYESNIWHKGDIYFNGVTYKSNTIKYDIFKDRLICLVNFSGNTYPIALNNTFLDGFSFNDHEFLNIKEMNSFTLKVYPGIYEILCSGKAGLYLKWEKTEELTSETSISYQQNNYLILYINEKYYRISNRFKLLRKLKDKQKELKKYIKNNGLTMFTDKNNSMKLIVEEYNNLMKK